MYVESFYGLAFNLSEMIKYFDFLEDYNFRYFDNFNKDDSMFNAMVDDFMNYHVNLENDMSMLTLTYNFNTKYMNESNLRVSYIDEKYYEPNIFHNRYFIVGYNLTHMNCEDVVSTSVASSRKYSMMFFNDINNINMTSSIHDIMRDKKLDYYHIRYDQEI